MCTKITCDGNCSRSACLIRVIHEWFDANPKADASSSVDDVRPNLLEAVVVSQKLARLIADIDYHLG